MSHPSFESLVNTAQGMQKTNSDKVIETKYLHHWSGCHGYIANSFKSGPKYLPGVMAEQLSILIVLVQLDIRMLRKLDADQLHYLDDESIDVRLSGSIPEVKFRNN